MNEMITCRDALILAENSRMATWKSETPLFSVLDIEEGPKGLRLKIPRELVESMIEDAGLTNEEIAKLLGCSRSTLQHRLKDWGISRRQCNISDDELKTLIISLKASVGMFYGERAMLGIIRSKGYWAPRHQVREILRKVDPEGIEARWKQAIMRRVYSVPFLNSLWHIDGHHKLICWKIVTHGGIDGKSRVVVYLRASNNNRAATVEEAFYNATETWGWPSHVRADWGGENVGVKALMEKARGPGRGSFFAGPSTHNQRIEHEL
ncbi:hypothetical protein FRC02_012306 [Tulasnella sp. 418]|nr:hypothetical protein FRC02_012306 [Tulasnella sp. 418]